MDESGVGVAAESPDTMSDLRANDAPFSRATIASMQAELDQLRPRVQAQHEEIQRLRAALWREWVVNGSLSAREAHDNG